MNSSVHGLRSVTMFCTHSAEKALASRTPEQCAGARRRRSPTGAAAYGTPPEDARAAISGGDAGHDACLDPHLRPWSVCRGQDCRDRQCDENSHHALRLAR
jgi:hypothetical protein